MKGIQSILVVGLTRNSSETITADVFRILSALKSCSKIYWLLVESDSEDDTHEKLEELGNKITNFRFISLGELRSNMPLRTERIAYCRNKYIEEISGNLLYKDIEYVIVIDFDGVNDLITEYAIISCWDRVDWDVCTANQRGPYYDIWALRHKDWSPNDCWSQYRFLVFNKLKVKKAKFAAVYSRMIEINEDSEWIEVDSAFGGLAIYRKKTLTDVVYVGLDECGDEVCEHISANNQIKSKGYRIFINPKLINCAYNDHTKRFKQNLLIKYVKNIFRILMNSSIIHPSLSGRK